MNRRDFLKDAASLGISATVASTGGTLNARALPGQQPVKPVDPDAPKGPPVSCAVVGASLQGREILTSLAKMSPFAPVAYVCDTYAQPGFDKRWKAIVPSAKYAADYKQVLDDKTVQAVFIATPSHKHKQIAVDALAAGKHVYCEAPLATDLAEAKEIARAAKDAKTNFQSGLQQRSNMQHKHVLKFVRGGAMGHLASGRAQWNKRTSWRFPWQDPERQKELNWRLQNETSSGLIGEIGIHSIDTATWFFKELPEAVSGMGGIKEYDDGRTVYDTVTCTIEYPKHLAYTYSSTLSSGFDEAYELFLGSASSIELRDLRAWMFKEADSPVLGWEVFARKDDLVFGDVASGTGLRVASGIALVADATKQLALGRQPGAVGTDLTKTALYQAISDFLDSIRTNVKPIVGAEEGYQATVVSHKANEAVVSGSRIVFQKEWFEV